MDWRQTAVVPEKAGLDAAAMDSIAAAIPADQQVLLAGQTRRFETAGWVAPMATIVLTKRALIVAKSRILNPSRSSGVVSQQLPSPTAADRSDCQRHPTASASCRHAMADRECPHG